MSGSPEEFAGTEPPTGESPRPPAPGGVAPGEEEDWASRFKYLLADFENFRKRARRDLDESRLRAQSGLLRDLLPLLESVERGRTMTEHLPRSDPVRRGIELIAQEFNGFMGREGVEAVADRGQPFDPGLHEAVGETAASREAPEGTIGEVVQQGYRYPGGLLRPAKVLIAREEEPAPPPATTEGPGRETAATESPED